MAGAAAASRRSLPRLAVRDHAPADDRHGGRRPITRSSWHGFPPSTALAQAELEEVLAAVGRAWLLRPRPQPPCLRQRDRGALAAAFRTARRIWHRAAGHRRLYGGGDGGDRVRPPALPVDGNVERVVARLFAVEAPLARRQAGRSARSPRGLRRPRRPGDFAQALMDLGATVCTPKAPACGLCPFMGAVRQRAGAAIRNRFPRKAKKRHRAALRCGAAYRRDARRRPRAGAPARRQRASRRHDRGADDSVASADLTRRRRWRRRRAAPLPAAHGARRSMAADRRHRSTHVVHAFSARACGLHGAAAECRRCARRHALDRGARDSPARPCRA